MIAVGQPGHIDQIKQTNAGAVYRLIDQLGPISRIELSKRAQLAPASITKIVRELLEAHLVKETEYQEIGSRGRPAVGLVLDTEAWHYLSARISRGSITLALRDLSSKLVVEEQLPLAAEHPEPLLKRILTEVDQFFIRHQSKLERLTAIAITLPGMIDVQSGVVHRMPFYDVLEMPLGPALETRTGLPVYLQHDISAWTMAEALYGASRGSQNVIQVVIDHNVGAGVITGGHVLHAGSHSVGRILAIMVNLFNPEKILVGSPLNRAAEILHPAIASCIRQQALPAYSEQVKVESTQFFNQGTMPGAALVKEALYNGSLLVQLLQG